MSKILVIGDFKEDTPQLLMNNSRAFAKGFIRLGWDVLKFSYRDMFLRFNPLGGKRWFVGRTRRKTDRLLFELTRHYQPEIVFSTAFKLLDAGTITRLREMLPKAKFVGWYGDMYEGVNPEIAATAKYYDWFLATSGGQMLENYHGLGVNCAFMPNPCDPDIHYHREVPAEWQSKILFTGKLKHSQSGQDALRWHLIERLRKDYGLTIWGGMDQRAVKGSDYLNAISGAEIALSINAFNKVRFYHSDRLIHYLSNGAFVLAKMVPDSNLLFEDGKHLCYFENEEQCIELIERLGRDEQARRKIAQAGMRHAHEQFNCTRLSGFILDLLEKGQYDAPWCEVLEYTQR